MTKTISEGSKSKLTTAKTLWAYTYNIERAQRNIARNKSLNKEFCLVSFSNRSRHSIYYINKIP
jgi:hypothetical protein